MRRVVGGSRRTRRIVIGAALSIVGAAALAAWWSGALARIAGTRNRAEEAYARGEWAAAERAAREELRLRPGDPALQRLQARSSVRLGRDEVALSLYIVHIPAGMREPEDDALLGLALYRRERIEQATQAWEAALQAERIPPPVLEELARILIVCHRREEAARSAERLIREPGWEARGRMILGTVRASLGDVAGAAESFRGALALNPNESEHSGDPVQLSKLVARTFLRAGRADEARPGLLALLSRKPDPETWWLLSRAYLLEGDRGRAREALSKSGSYRADHPLEAEPGPYVGEARCESCHARIYRDSLASRHTQSYYRGRQLDGLPRPDRPLPDPDDPSVTHAVRKSDGRWVEETRVGSRALEMVIEYAFGTADRYLTTVGRDAGGGYRISRLSYYQTAEGRGWDRSALDKIRPTRVEDFQGEPIGVRDGLAKCLYCHTTNPRSGRETTGPEASDRAVGCERCHGPGGPHLAAVAAGFPDMAIVSPATASARQVTEKQCNDCHILGRGFSEDLLDDPSWVRSPGIGWTYSRCNTESGGTFGCVTCHDPHRPAAATTTAQHEAKCVSCHAAKEGGRRTCTGDATKGCVGCHMPRVRFDALHMSLTDHYIRVRRGSAAAGDGGRPKAAR